MSTFWTRQASAKVLCMGTFLLAGLVVGLLPFLLLARISHWAYYTRRELQDTNKWLAAIHAELKKNPSVVKDKAA